MHSISYQPLNAPLIDLKIVPNERNDNYEAILHVRVGGYSLYFCGIGETRRRAEDALTVAWRATIDDIEQLTAFRRQFKGKIDWALLGGPAGVEVAP
jgi:hypothetical protein